MTKCHCCVSFKESIEEYQLGSTTANEMSSGSVKRIGRSHIVVESGSNSDVWLDFFYRCCRNVSSCWVFYLSSRQLRQLRSTVNSKRAILTNASLFMIIKWIGTI
jgi:hypothetical protein